MKITPEFFRKFVRENYSKTSNNRTGGANNEYRGGPGGPGTGFCSPGGGFSDSRSSGKPLLLLRLKKPPPGPPKPAPGPQKPPPGPPISKITTLSRLFRLLEYY